MARWGEWPVDKGGDLVPLTRWATCESEYYGAHSHIWKVPPRQKKLPHLIALAYTRARRFSASGSLGVPGTGETPSLRASRRKVILKSS